MTTDTWQRRPVFSKPGPARILTEQLIECRERGFYQLHAFVIMPEHLHVLLTPGEETSLEKAMQMTKGGASFRIKKELLYQWPIWHAGFHDRWIRDAGEFTAKKRYIETNPVAAGIVERENEYELGSAAGRYRMDPSKFD